MTKWTTPDQRQEFYNRHQGGETYPQIAERYGFSIECVRDWCRRLRDGGSSQTVYHRGPTGLLQRFDPKVRYGVLRLRLEHPRWGPGPIQAKLQERPSLRHLRIPSQTSIGRYLHQWLCFRRQPKQKLPHQRPQQPTAVHQRWQLDFKLGIALQGGTLINLHTIQDPVGEACLGASIFPAGQAGQRPKNPTAEEARSSLRRCFTRWGTLPDGVQTDNDAALVGKPDDPFPSTFTLWLKGLGADHLTTRPGMPTDNAEVERCHRTITDYAIIGNEKVPMPQLQAKLDEAVHELAFVLPSHAAGCHGQPPVVAHPELLQPRRPFQPEQELALFDLRRVDAYLATFTWKRLVGKSGQITLGGQHQYYSVGRAYARRYVWVRFDPADRHFVFYDADSPEREIGRRPARNLEVADLTGLAAWPLGLGIQQLPLPFHI